jgi:hypothetical protein
VESLTNDSKRNYFTKDEDYKINVIPRDEQLFKDGKNLGGEGL